MASFTQEGEGYREPEWVPEGSWIKLARDVRNALRRLFQQKGFLTETLHYEVEANIIVDGESYMAHRLVIDHVLQKRMSLYTKIFLGEVDPPRVEEMVNHILDTMQHFGEIGEALRERDSYRERDRLERVSLNESNLPYAPQVEAILWESGQGERKPNNVELSETWEPPEDAYPFSKASIPMARKAGKISISSLFSFELKRIRSEIDRLLEEGAVKIFVTVEIIPEDGGECCDLEVYAVFATGEPEKA